VGKITPVHVFTSGDVAELFLNGRSLGRKRKMPYEYRFRWDSVVYEPGELRVAAYKHGKIWAADTVRTAGKASGLELRADRSLIRADGRDLLFITARIVDRRGMTAPCADNAIVFEVTGPGEIVATDNGDPSDLRSFASKERKAFNGLALAIVQTKKNIPGVIRIKATSNGLSPAGTEVKSK
jgi:beta-galactosidase